MAADLQSSRDDTERLGQELAQKEEEVRRQDDEIREKDALLAKYKGILGIEK